MNEQAVISLEPEEDVDAIIRKNNYKLTADKIMQILSKILNSPSISAKRWIWELMQNAKDIKNKFNEVSIEVELYPDKLIFKHNGNPFKMTNLTGLIQQVSSKDSSNSDVDVTGKFGTGFISTHLLSKIINVKGIVDHKSIYREFELVLDRSGRSSEELLPKIELALEKIRAIETDSSFIVRSNYESKRKEGDLDTQFTYTLDDQDNQKAAKEGLDDLVNTLPLTLVNVSKIKSVRIVNHISDTDIEYRRHSIVSGDSEENFFKSSIQITDKPTKHFITYRKSNLSLSVEVKSFEELELVEHFGKTPNLYRDFPLVGSEKFYFPYIINGFRLHPTEDRDGIPIHSESAPDHMENRALIDEAFLAAQELTSYLIQHKAKNLYVCAYSRLPDEKWTKKSKEWYTNLQTEYRRFLSESTVVETEFRNKVNLEHVVIPRFGDRDNDNLKFYDTIIQLVGTNKVPARDILLSWIKSIGPKNELETWGREIEYSLDNALKSLHETKSLDKLSEILGDQIDTMDWLNDLYAFIIEFKKTEAFAEYAIIPNQEGFFQKLTPDTLYLEDSNSSIPDEFLDILDRLGDNWREKLIHRGVMLLGQNIDKRGLPLVSNRINELISDEGIIRCSNYIDIIIDILRNVESLDNTDNFRIKIFEKGKNILKFEKTIRQVKNIKDFSFDKALHRYILAVNKRIENFKTLEALSIHLEKEKDFAVSWLNNYLNIILAKADFTEHLKDANIVLNQYEEFCAYEDLKAFGTPDEPLDQDLVAILKKLNSSEDWKEHLVIDGLSINLPPRKFSELAVEIDYNIKEIEKEEAVTPGYINSYENTIFELIEWTNLNPEKSHFLSHFLQRKNDLWVKFSMTDELLSLIKDKESLETLEIINASGLSKEDIKELADLYPNGLPSNVMEYAKEVARKEKEFNFLLQIGTEVERAFVKALEKYKVEKNITHIGSGSYDIRVYNPENKKSFYIELKSCKYGNNDPINIAVSQVKRAVRELPNKNFAIVIIERPSSGKINDNYIESNTKYLKNPGKHLEAISENYDMINKTVNTKGIVNLRMNNAEFKGLLDYEWIKDETISSGFEELLDDIQRVLS